MGSGRLIALGRIQRPLVSSVQSRARPLVAASRPHAELPKVYTPRSVPPVSTGSGRAIRLRLQRGDLVRSADKAASSYSPEFAIHESEQISWMVRSDRLARFNDRVNSSPRAAYWSATSRNARLPAQRRSGRLRGFAVGKVLHDFLAFPPGTASRRPACQLGV